MKYATSTSYRRPHVAGSKSYTRHIRGSTRHIRGSPDHVSCKLIPAPGPRIVLSLVLRRPNDDSLSLSLKEFFLLLGSDLSPLGLRGELRLGHAEHLTELLVAKVLLAARGIHSRDFLAIPGHRESGVRSQESVERRRSYR